MAKPRLVLFNKLRIGAKFICLTLQSDGKIHKTTAKIWKKTSRAAAISVYERAVCPSTMPWNTRVIEIFDSIVF